MDAGSVKLLVALALILMSGLSVVSSAAPPKSERPPRERKPAPLQESGAAPPPVDMVSASLPIAVPSTGSTRPRIFTGEPFGVAEANPGAGRRTLKLVVGLTAMAVIGALAILGIVRGLVTVFQGLAR